MSLELSGTTPAIKGVAGSVSAPALTGDDVDTGISFPSANTIKFSTGGVERISITDAGISGTGISAGGKFASYAIICDQKSQNTNGGTFTAGAWRTRDLNTEITDADGIVSISSNQFTLQAGSYLIEASAPAYKANRHMLQLYQTSGSATNIQEGTSMYASNAGAGYSVAHLFARVTISGATTYEIRHYASNTETTHGFGIATEHSTEIYTVVKIFKES